MNSCSLVSIRGFLLHQIPSPKRQSTLQGLRQLFARDLHAPIHWVKERGCQNKLFTPPHLGYLPVMSTVKEIEAAIPKLSPAEIEELREWIDDYFEDQLELTDDVKVKLDESRAEIAAGQYTKRGQSRAVAAIPR